MRKELKYLFFILAFIEGGAVMCVELCSAKILSPYFGTSIYVWAAVLGITLTALMCGYYLGGYLSSKHQKKEIIFWTMLLAGCLTSLTPVLSNLVLPFTLNLNILAGTIISLLSFLFAPLLLLGAVSPLIINTLTKEAHLSGKSSGTVYAISTFGGIITTFTVGFYTLPQFGISNTLHAYGLLVVIISIILFIVTKTFTFSSALLLLLAIFSYNFQSHSNNEEIIHQSEGILGEIKVVDRKHFSKKKHKIITYRELMVNNISQTIMDKEDPNLSYWDYVNVLTDHIHSYANGKQTLLLGLGGGTLYKQLKKNELIVNLVEIDERIEKLAKKYFHIEDNVTVKIDDARHYLNTTTAKYDIIIYDLYHSETPPIHLMTKEAFAEIKEKLTEEGILIINFYGFITGDKGKAARSIYKTLLDENYHVQLSATPGKENARNLLFIAGVKNLNQKREIVHTTIDKKSIDLMDAFVLTDDKPILEHIYLEAAINWRKDYNEINAKHFLKKM